MKSCWNDFNCEMLHTIRAVSDNLMNENDVIVLMPFNLILSKWVIDFDCSNNSRRKTYGLSISQIQTDATFNQISKKKINKA